MKRSTADHINEQTKDRLADPNRLDVVEFLGLLNTEAIAALDRTAKLASKIIDAPISLVSLLDVDRQLFKGMHGLAEPYATQRTTPISHSFCQYVVGTDEPLITNDAREHPLLADNMAIADLNIIAYLGMPLRIQNGPALGSFCVIDTKPREWTDQEIEILRGLAQSVMTELELRAEIEHHTRAEQRIVDLKLDIERREMLEFFVRDFSHEFRTALSTISSSAYLLKRAESPEGRERFLSQVNQSVESITKLVDSMLLFTQVDKLDSKHLHATTNLTEAIQNVLDSTESAMSLKEIHVDYDIPDALPLVRGDPRYLTIAMEQLMNNAIAFSYQGNTIEIVVNVGNAAIIMDIINHGDPIVGIARESIFQLFYREDPARSERGLGLGLPIAKRIMERYNGGLDLTRSDASATVFRITFASADD